MPTIFQKWWAFFGYILGYIFLNLYNNEQSMIQISYFFCIFAHRVQV